MFRAPTMVWMSRSFQWVAFVMAQNWALCCARWRASRLREAGVLDIGGFRKSMHVPDDGSRPCCVEVACNDEMTDERGSIFIGVRQTKVELDAFCGYISNSWVHETAMGGDLGNVPQALCSLNRYVTTVNNPVNSGEAQACQSKDKMFNFRQNPRRPTWSFGIERVPLPIWSF